MARWKIVQADDSDEDALTEMELRGIGVMFKNYAEQGNLHPGDVYDRAWEKIMPWMERATELENG